MDISAEHQYGGGTEPQYREDAAEGFSTCPSVYQDRGGKPKNNYRVPGSDRLYKISPELGANSRAEGDQKPLPWLSQGFGKYAHPCKGREVEEHPCPATVLNQQRGHYPPRLEKSAGKSMAFKAVEQSRGHESEAVARSMP